ncbi:hypothetical protein ACWEJP_27910, partial [Streptomyces sp. NPDC004749]
MAMRPVQPDWMGPGKPMPLLNVVEVDKAGQVQHDVPGLVHLPGTAHPHVVVGPCGGKGPLVTRGCPAQPVRQQCP